MLSAKVKDMIEQGKYDENLSYLYVCDFQKVTQYRKRLIRAVENFEKLFGTDRNISIFSAPGRTEVGGNHTDHQRGRVLAASVNLDVIAVVAVNESNQIQVKSEGYPMVMTGTLFWAFSIGCFKSVELTGAMTIAFAPFLISRCISAICS